MNAYIINHNRVKYLYLETIEFYEKNENNYLRVLCQSEVTLSNNIINIFK